MAKKISTKKTQPETANAVIETPAKKKAPARKRAVKSAQATEAAAQDANQDVKPAAPEFTLDYPQKGEVVTSPNYTLRLSVPEGASHVEVAVDGGAYAGCRFSVGHWWYDWSDYADGKRVIVARAVTQDGREATLQRTVTVSRQQADLLR